ncbi:DUF192 domain-containing protein [Patescibacteria group bacterium]|nr:DUF192 domain-containing protein [Patescibacteria group bacterium]
MTKVKYLLLILILLTGCQMSQTANKKVIRINQTELQVEIVETPQEIAQGLSGRKNLCENCGLLFEFADYQVRHFWMKEMQFPLDIIWVKDEVIAGIAENVPIFDLNGQISRVQSSEQVNKVLEVNAGWAENHSIKTGDKVGGLD